MVLFFLGGNLGTLTSTDEAFPFLEERYITMKGYPMNSNAVVEAFGRRSITGNVIPIEWFKHLKMDSGKPDVNGMMILADLVYWYRPIEVRDEITGEISWRKKFAGKILQRNYPQLQKFFGFTRDQIYFALQRLSKLGVIMVSLENIKVDGRFLGNVMYIELNPEKFDEITYPPPSSNALEEGYASALEDPLLLQSHTYTETTVQRLQDTENYIKERPLFPEKTEPTAEEILGVEAKPVPPQRPPRTADEIKAEVRASVEKFQERSNGKSALECQVHDYSQTIPENLRNLFTAFCLKFGRLPLKNEKIYWINELGKQKAIGITPQLIEAAFEHCDKEGICIKSPASITAFAENIKRVNVHADTPYAGKTADQVKREAIIHYGGTWSASQHRLIPIAELKAMGKWKDD